MELDEVRREAEAKTECCPAQAAEGNSKLVEDTRRRGGCKTKKEELGPDCKGLALSIVPRSLDSDVEKMKNQRLLLCTPMLQYCEFLKPL